MYKIIGVDGREYGPVTLEQVKQWVAEGRVNARTLVQAGGAADWKAAGDVPDISSLLAASAPPALPGMLATAVPGASGSAPQQGLAITSFILGIVSFALCLGLLTGIPAILCGYAARNRAQRSPERYGGAGLAFAGLILGCLSVVYTVMLVWMLLPVVGNTRLQAQVTMCNSQMKQIGLALRMWALDHEDAFPFNVSTNAGGTKELCRPGPDGFDRNAPAHLAVIGKELGNTAVFICPSDKGKRPAAGFSELGPMNVSYLLHTGSEVTDTNAVEILLKCPVHGTVLRCDGSVENKRLRRRL